MKRFTAFALLVLAVPLYGQINDNTVTVSGDPVGQLWNLYSANTNGAGATRIGIVDAGGSFTGSTVEAALSELASTGGGTQSLAQVVSVGNNANGAISLGTNDLLDASIIAGPNTSAMQITNNATIYMRSGENVTITTTAGADVEIEGNDVNLSALGTLSLDAVTEIDVNGNMDLDGVFEIRAPLDPTNGVMVGDRDYNDLRYLSLSGGTMSGNLNMGGNALTNASVNGSDIDHGTVADARIAATIARVSELVRPKTLYVETDGDWTDDNIGGPMLDFGASCTLNEINIAVDGTSMGIRIFERGPNVLTGGAIVYSNVVTAAAGTNITTFLDASIAAEASLWVQPYSESGTPTKCKVDFKFTRD